MRYFRWTISIAMVGFFLLGGSIYLAGASGGNQDIVVVKYGTAPPSPNQAFTVQLTLDGPQRTIAAIAFKVAYDTTQVSLDTVKDNTGQPGMGVLYDLGPVTASTTCGIGTNGYRIVLMTSLQNLTNVVNLGELQFTALSGYKGPAVIRVMDRTATASDGLVNGSFVNIPHKFDLSGIGIVE